MTEAPTRTSAEHAYLIRSVLTRELERRMANRASLDNYPLVEEVQAALDSLAALRLGNPSGNLPELRKRAEWMRKHWDVSAKYAIVKLAEDLLAELERRV